MKTTRQLAWIGLAMLLWTGLPLASRDAGAQRGTDARLEKRVEQLENRVAKLERRLFGNHALTVQDATTRLAAAKERLEFNERLYTKGYINNAQVEAARFAVERSQKELDLAQAVAGGKPGDGEIRKEIELLEARQNLVVAEEQLEYVKRMAGKGFTTRAEVAAHRVLVERAKTQLEQIQAAQNGNRSRKEGKADPEDN